MTILTKILALLNDNEVKFKHRTHTPTYTSEQSAATRGESLSSGAKAILYKVQDEFSLFVMAADQKMDPKKIKTFFKAKGKKAKKTRFATPDELLDLTGLASGSVPPFGQPILDFELFVDPSLLKNESISFNAGSLKHSLTMSLVDYVKIAHPTIFNFISES